MLSERQTPLFSDLTAVLVPPGMRVSRQEGRQRGRQRGKQKGKQKERQKGRHPSQRAPGTFRGDATEVGNEGRRAGLGIR